MKKAIGMFLLMVWAMISLTACAGKQADVQRVKCPACGYEFDSSINQL
jgi:predicted Zn-ribbon and HTH transcriptional regulator